MEKNGVNEASETTKEYIDKYYDAWDVYEHLEMYLSLISGDVAIQPKKDYEEENYI